MSRLSFETKVGATAAASSLAFLAFMGIHRHLTPYMVPDMIPDNNSVSNALSPPTVEFRMNHQQTVELSPNGASLIIDAGGTSTVSGAASHTDSVGPFSVTFTDKLPDQMESDMGVAVNADVRFNNLACKGGRLIAGATVKVPGSTTTSESGPAAPHGIPTRLHDNAVPLQGVIDCTATTPSELASMTELPVLGHYYPVSTKPE